MHDIAIIGGGINGCGIARDAAGRGLSVLLAEKGDLASGTSSASTKLIHGGLRYLEQYHFRLVRESLQEREVLLAIAPHIVSPMRFVLPHHGGLRPAFLIRLGLLLYDHLGGRRALPRSKPLDLARGGGGKELKPHFVKGFEYSDCWVDDARLVVLNAVDAAARGAKIQVRTEVVSAERVEDHWRIDLRNGISGRNETARARALVNASGAWLADVGARRIKTPSVPRIRLVKGSHIVVRRLFEHGNGYIFQNADRRVVFAIPFEQDFTLIGTTDVDYDGDAAKAEISSDEVRYLCAAVNEYIALPVAPSDVIWSYSGVRSLHDDGQHAAQDATRDFVLDLDGRRDEPPLLSVVGGKITTYRRLAEQALKLLAPACPHIGPSWTQSVSLPGGNFAYDQRDKLARELLTSFPMLSAGTADRLARTYGTVARDIFAGAACKEDLGLHFGADLYEREVAYLTRNEWVTVADDILWRRTKLGLRFTQSQRDRLDEWLRNRIAASSAAGE